MHDISSGTIIFLFTDIEGSTKLWETYPEAMNTSLALHDKILRGVIENHEGCVFKTVGDAFCAVFATVPEALSSAIEGQRSLHNQDWGETGELRVRMALHTGAVEERDGDYFGPPVNRVARLLSEGHGGQILLSQVTHDLIRDDIPERVTVSHLGEHRLKDLNRPEKTYKITADGLSSEFASLKTLDARPSNLPIQPTSFIGREKEIRQARELLLRSDVRRLTFTGPGGIGKTRLAMQDAADVIDEFENGVFLVQLDVITDTGLVDSTIAITLGLQESGDQPVPQLLKRYLKEKQVLLILDNFAPAGRRINSGIACWW